jgi:four helix bundle protein
MAFKFENLKVWQRAVDLSGDIDELTRGFPKEELYVLTSQIKRASDSIALNIAEGSTGQTDKEFNRFLGIALRSGIEVVTCLYIGRRRKIITNDDFSRFYSELTELIKMIQALRNTLK